MYSTNLELFNALFLSTDNRSPKASGYDTVSSSSTAHHDRPPLGMDSTTLPAEHAQAADLPSKDDHALQDHRSRTDRTAATLARTTQVQQFLAFDDQPAGHHTQEPAPRPAGSGGGDSTTNVPNTAFQRGSRESDRGTDTRFAR